MWSVKKKKTKHMSNPCIKITETLLNNDLTVLGSHCDGKNFFFYIPNLLTRCVKNLACCCVLLIASKYSIIQKVESVTGCSEQVFYVSNVHLPC